MLLYLSGQCLYHLTGCVEMSIAQDIYQMVIAKLTVLAVLGFVQSIGIDEQRTTLDTVYLLALELQSWHYADGEVGQHLQELAVMLATTDYRWVMAGIAEG